MKTILMSGVLLLSVFSSGVSFGALNCTNPSEAEIAKSKAVLSGNADCSTVVNACVAAKYYLGCHGVNKMGLIDECLKPLRHGTAVAGVSLSPTDAPVLNCTVYCKSKGHPCRQHGI